MRAGNNDEFTRRGLNPKVERTPKRKLRWKDVNDSRAVGFGDGNGRVRRAGVNQYDFDVIDRLLFDAFQQASNVFFFVIGANDNRAAHDFS